MKSFVGFAFVAFVLVLFQAGGIVAAATATTADGETCETVTDTCLVLDATITDHGSFKSSLDSVYSTPRITETALIGLPDSTSLKGYNHTNSPFSNFWAYDADILTSAGFKLANLTAAFTVCSKTTLPPPPPPVDFCLPYFDDGHYGWDCATATGSLANDLSAFAAATATAVPPMTTPATLSQTTSNTYSSPTTPPSSLAAAEETHTTEEEEEEEETTALTTCSPHLNHWHCPNGMFPPPTPPSPEQLSAAAHPTTAEAAPATCSPHHDHWDCPPGVSSPATPPSPAELSAAAAHAAITTTTIVTVTVTMDAAAAAAAASSSEPSATTTESSSSGAASDINQIVNESALCLLVTAYLFLEFWDGFCFLMRSVYSD